MHSSFIPCTLHKIYIYIYILTIIITSLPLLTKNPLVITPVPSTLKVNAPSDIKKAIIHNLISRAKLISSSKTIFYKEVENIKQALINNGFSNYIVDEQIKRMIKNVNQQNKHCTTPPSQQTYIKLFIVTKCTTIINQMKKYWKHWFQKHTPHWS